MTTPTVQRREPAFVLVLSILTLGLYLPFWYHGIYEDLQALDGKTPTGRGYWLDFWPVMDFLRTLIWRGQPRKKKIKRHFFTETP